MLLRLSLFTYANTPAALATNYMPTLGTVAPNDKKLEPTTKRATASSAAFVKVKDAGRVSKKDQRSASFFGNEGTPEGPSHATKAVRGGVADDEAT